VSPRAKTFNTASPHSLRTTNDEVRQALDAVARRAGAQHVKIEAEPKGNFTSFLMRFTGNVRTYNRLNSLVWTLKK
jgi:hypothetical protein